MSSDFAKAFDTVSHALLLSKMAYEFGFDPHLLKFLDTYLQNRKQTITIRGFTSQAFTPTSGVPQGSNLGPLMFLIFINSLANVVNNNCGILLFADDMKLFLAVKDENNCKLLQDNINRVLQWSVDNKLKFNIDKCSVLVFLEKKNVYVLNMK